LVTLGANEGTRREEARPHTNAEWESLFDGLTDCVTIHDDQFNIISANSSARRMLELPSTGSLTSTKCFACLNRTGFVGGPIS
jgi:PAS domain-containing protein